MLDEKEINCILNLMSESPGGASEEDVRDVLEWARLVRIQNCLLELFLDGLVTVKFDRRQHQPGPSPDQFQAEWEIWSSAMFSVTEDPVIKDLVRMHASDPERLERELDNLRPQDNDS
jgi:hypothetical protein